MVTFHRHTPGSLEGLKSGAPKRALIFGLVKAISSLVCRSVTMLLIMFQGFYGGLCESKLMLCLRFFNVWKKSDNV